MSNDSTQNETPETPENQEPETLETNNPESPDSDYILSTGKEFKILRLKGKDVRRAQSQTGTGKETDKFLSYYMAMGVVIDNRPVVAEDLDEMPGADYLKIQAKFNEINF